MAKNKILGITDLPCKNKEQDLLKISNYVTGLKNFILNCPTPMSIAIQGDWGTGKTSAINLLQNELEANNTNDNKVKCVYFNTWQYSQFNMSDDLYISFVNSLIKRFSDSELKRSIKKSVFNLGKKLLFNVVEKTSGINVEDMYENAFEKNEERMDTIEEFKQNFKSLIDHELGSDENARLVIFIDDLDRLNPEIAVELLEVIKLFMDVEKCIFVLAIDYDVVVTGVRNKYGANVSEAKCKSFFDKIIQLPFRMPVESYDLNALISDKLKDYFDGTYSKIVADFVSSVMGTNPRAFKRLANSFFLIQSVKQATAERNSYLDNTMVLCGLCVQLCIPPMYSLMASSQEDTDWVERIVSEDVQTIMDYDELKTLKDSPEGEIFIEGLEAFVNLFNRLKKEGVSHEQATQALTNSFELTTITSVAPKKQGQFFGANVKVTGIDVNGIKKEVKNPTEALVYTYKYVLDGDMDKINGFMQFNRRILTTDSSAALSYFRTKRELCSENGVTVYIGTASSTTDKMKCITILCNYMKELGETPVIKWYDNNGMVFSENF